MYFMTLVTLFYLLTALIFSFLLCQLNGLCLHLLVGLEIAKEGFNVQYSCTKMSLHSIAL